MGSSVHFSSDRRDCFEAAQVVRYVCCLLFTPSVLGSFIAMAFFDKFFFGPFCSLFCTGISVFGIVVLFTLGTLFKAEYQYTGVDFAESAKAMELSPPQTDEEARAAIAKGCFGAAVFYMASLVWSGFSILYNKKMKRL